MDRRARQDTGAIAVVVAIFAVVAFGFGAIVVDLGYARMVKGQAQDAADSAALAAAAALSDGGSAGFVDEVSAAQSNVQQVLGVEPAEWAGCVDPGRLAEPAPGVPCVSFDAEQDDNPREVRVRIPGVPAYSFFGGIFGYGDTTISGTAVASLGPVTFTPECAICVLSAEEQSVSGRIETDSADISFAGDVGITVGSVRARGRTVFLGGVPTGSVAAFGDALVTRAGPIINPLQDEEEPSDPLDLIPVPLPPPPEPPPVPPIPPPPRIDPCNSDPVIGGSGIYDGDIILGLRCELTAGTYVFNGSVSAVEGADVFGADVQLWIRESLDLSSARSVDLQSLSGSVIYASLGNAATINPFGTLTTNIGGSINVPGGTIVGGPTADCTIAALVVVSGVNIDNGRCLISTATTTRTTAPTQPPVLIR